MGNVTSKESSKKEERKGLDRHIIPKSMKRFKGILLTRGEIVVSLREGGGEMEEDIESLPQRNV